MADDALVIRMKLLTRADLAAAALERWERLRSEMQRRDQCRTSDPNQPQPPAPFRSWSHMHQEIRDALVRLGPKPSPDDVDRAVRIYADSFTLFYCVACDRRPSEVVVLVRGCGVVRVEDYRVTDGGTFLCKSCIESLYRAAELVRVG